MRGLPRWNFDAFDEAAARYRAQGLTIVSPAEHDVELGLNPDDAPHLPDWFCLEDALRWDLEQVCKADGIILLPGWETSEGAKKEKAVAEWTGREVRYDVPAYAHMRGVDGPGAYEQLPGVNPVAAACATHRVADKNGEVRVVDPKTGGAKGQKDAQISPLDPRALLRVAEVAGYGAKKYDRVNYLKGFAWHLSFDAMQRHLLEFWAGENIDPESHLPHLAHAAWHCLALLAFLEKGLGTDDRYTSLH